MTEGRLDGLAAVVVVVVVVVAVAAAMVALPAGAVDESSVALSCDVGVVVSVLR